MKLQRLTDLASRMVLGMLLAGWVVMLSGCVRMAVLPKADESITGAMSQPRQVDKLKVPLERDPTKVYRIGARDAIRVDVRKDPSLSQTYFVTEEGNILLPNIGPLQVANLTTQEIQTRLNGILAQYIREPEVKVGVQDYRSKTISVVGQVRNQGPQIMRADMLTLQEAIFNAGLITPEAAPQRTQVITPDPENPVVRQIDLSDIIYKGKMRENILLKPGDIVYVPARYSVNLAAAIHDLLRPANEPVDLYYRLQYANNNNNDNNDNNNGHSNTNNTAIITPPTTTTK